MIHNRDLSDVLQVAGADVENGRVTVADYVQPVYVLDSLEYSLPARGGYRARISAVPTAAVGEFSTVQFQSLTGFWIRRLLVTVACITDIRVNFLSTIDPGFGPNVLIFAPEQSTFRTQICNTSQCTQPFLVGPRTAPAIFLDYGFGNNSGGFMTGHTAAGGNGVFIAGNVDLVPATDAYWLAPNTSFFVQATATNTTFIFAMDVELPSVSGT